MAILTTSEVRRAIAAAELDVVYQPEVDLRTGHIAAVEALVRWRRPGGDLCLPPEFIPLAEREGLIPDVTAIVLRRALSQAAAWRTARWDRGALPVWVNLSAHDLADDTLPTRIGHLLDISGVAPTQLGLEVTETAPIADLTFATTTLNALRSMGIRIALDDFGTGHCALSHLRDLPADVLKIDRGFVSGVTNDGADRAIVTAIIEMAHALRYVVVAEGVEDTEQQDALVALGCDLGQGYLYTSPQPAHCIDILLEADRDLAAFPNRSRAPMIELPRPRPVPSDAVRITP